MHLTSRIRIAPLHGLSAAALAVVLLVGRGLAQDPAPVAPTVPVPIAGPNAVGTVKVKTLQRNAPQNNNENDAVPELTLADCIAIAIDRQPSLTAVRASQGATSAGFNALSNIGRIGTLFGEAGVNIANMAVSRTNRGGKALMAVSLDTPAPPELVDSLRGAGLDDAYFISLGADALTA